MRCQSFSAVLLVLALTLCLVASADAVWDDLTYMHSLGRNYYLANKTAVNRAVTVAPSNATSDFLYSITWASQSGDGSVTYNATHWYVDRGRNNNDFVRVTINLLVKGVRPTVVGLRIKALSSSTTQRYLVFTNPATGVVLCSLALPNAGINIQSGLPYTCEVPAGVTQVRVRVVDSSNNEVWLSLFTFNVVTDEIVVVENPDPNFQYLFVMAGGSLTATHSARWFASPRTYDSILVLRTSPAIYSEFLDLRYAYLRAIVGGAELSRRVMQGEAPYTGELPIDSVFVLGENATLASLFVSSALQNRLFVTHGNNSNRFVNLYCVLRNHTYVDVRTFTFEKPAIVIQLDASGNEIWARGYTAGTHTVPIARDARYIAVYDYETNVLSLFLSIAPTQTVTVPAVGQYMQMNATPFTPLIQLPQALATVAREHPAMFALLPALIISAGGRKYGTAFIALAGAVTYVIVASITDAQLKPIITNSALLLSIAFLASVVEEVRRR